MNTRRRALIAYECLAVASLLALTGGCGDGRETVYPATGQITVDGEPASGAVVTLIPQEGSEEFRKMRPYAYADADGRFAISCYLDGDGAPPGRSRSESNGWVNLRPPVVEGARSRRRQVGRRTGRPARGALRGP
ncbi:MAG: hypothetical protein R3C10_22490 [Pirellulales bacterium]